MNIDYKELLSLRYYKKLIPNEVYFTSKGIFRAISKNRYTEFIIKSNNLSDLNKDDVGLSNVDNTADVNKPLSNPVENFLTLNYYPLDNPNNYVDESALSEYLTIESASTTYYSLKNPSKYISEITSRDVTNALGYTPVNQSGDTMTGDLILNADPTNALGAATKQYVDNVTIGLNFHEPVHAATTGNLPVTYFNGLSGVGATITSTSNRALVVDGHTMSTGERLMVWQQSAGLENGIYNVTDTGSLTTPFILTRSADADNSPSGELAYGDFCFVQQGDTYGGFGFIMNTTGTVNIGTTPISYVQFNAAQAVTAGYGLQELTPNSLSINDSVIATVDRLSSYITSAAAVTTYFPIPTGTTSQYLRGDGSVATLPLKLQYNNSVSTQAITANTVTYLTGSAITTANIKAGTVVTWTISVTKTNAGTAAPAWTVKFGTNASTADTTLLSFTGAAQTAAVDTGMFTIQCTFRTVGSGTSAVLVGHYSLVHQLDSTGLSTGNGGAFATSAGFNSTTANAFLGLTVNSGASAVWTVNQVNVKIENIV